MTLFDTIRQFRKRYFFLGALALCFLVGFFHRVVFS